MIGIIAIPKIDVVEEPNKHPIEAIIRRKCEPYRPFKLEILSVEDSCESMHYVITYRVSND